jgi:osmotically-inducible protein OsmY
MKMKSTMLIGMTGAALAYLFDPELGRTRRARLTGEAAGTVRRGAKKTVREMAQKAEFTTEKTMGAMHEMRAPHGHAPDNDKTLADKVTSEVLGYEPWRKYVVNVNAVDGVVTLRGQLEHPEEINRLIDEVRQIPGVREVESYLHLPGTIPPNKREAFNARVT